MFKITLATLAVLILSVQGQNTANAGNKTTGGNGNGRRNFYGSKANITFADGLNCGGCIKGGFVYCIPGAFGSTRDTWAGKKSVCCKDSTCAAASDKTYNCSNQFNTKAGAMEMCPFDKGQCGQRQAFEFNNVGEQDKVSISLDQGATCTYKIKANKGLPTFSPSVSEGFDISVVDYDDDDVPASRMLQTDDAPLQQTGPKTVQNGTARNNTGRTRPDVPKNMKVANDGVKTQTNGKKGNKVVGPQEGVFDPTARKDYKFKGGKMNGPADSVDKPKYQQISVTNIGSLDASTRLLQSATLDLTIGSTNFDDAGAFNQIALSAIAVFVGLVTMSF